MLTALAPFAHALGRQLPKTADQAQPHHGAHHHFRHHARDAGHRTRPIADPQKAGGEVAARRFLPQEAVDFGKAAQKTVGKALRALGRDLGNLLVDMGFKSETVREMVKGLIEPVRTALRQGTDFTAEISLVALSQDTLVTNGAIAQNTQIVAKSLDIEVNHTTGEFSISLQSLSIEQSTLAIGGGVSLDSLPQGLELGDAGLADFIQRLLDGAAPQDEKESPEAATHEPAQDAELLEQLVDAANNRQDAAEKPHRHASPTRRSGPSDSRFAIRSIERFENFAGQLITRLRLDASVPLQAEAQPTAESEQPGLLDLQV